MKSTLVGMAMIVVLVGCAKANTVTAASPVSLSPSANAQTPLQRLQALLDANPPLVVRICDRAARLAAVGWPEQTIPSQLHPYLTKADLAQLQGSGLPLNRSLAEVLLRC